MTYSAYGARLSGPFAVDAQSIAACRVIEKTLDERSPFHL
jgi:hypothetical protein